MHLTRLAYRLKKIGRRALFYVQQGYGLASLPFVFVGYASSIYYLAIENIPALKMLFPHFTDFLLIAGFILVVFCGTIGYGYMKRLWLFRESQEIITEANPYASEKIPPVAVPLYKAMREVLLRQTGSEGLVKELDELIRRSQSKNESSVD